MLVVLGVQSPAVSALLLRVTDRGSDAPALERLAPRGPAEAGTPVGTERVTSRTLGRIACENLGREPLLRTWRGVREGRSGEILMIAKEPNFVNGGLTHATPFDYTQEVPVFLYGPGYVRPGAYERPITLADVAPTTAALLKFPFEALDGQPQLRALLPEDERPLPALILTVIWDSVGINVLERWADAWPKLRSLSRHGAWFEHATVGASPSNTPVSHATIGSGAFPRHHGLVDVYIRLNGRIEEPNASGPMSMLEPTLADLYDVAMGNEPKVGAVATLAEQLMMMSRGSAHPGGDRDLAITRTKRRGPTTGLESARWNLAGPMAPYYELPSYVNRLAPIEDYVPELDRADGALDGRWRENDIAQLGNGFDTPARAPFQQALVETVIGREGFGADDVPDLLYVNFKATDKIGHLFSVDGVEMSDTLASQDATLGRLVRFLDREVGEGRWVMALAGDHGTQRDPEKTGAFMIDAEKLRAGLAAEFDDDDEVPLVQKLRPTQIWLDREELVANGFDLRRVSMWLLGLTQAETYLGQNLPEPGRENETVFAAALPSASLSKLRCLPEAREPSGG